MEGYDNEFSQVNFNDLGLELPQDTHESLSTPVNSPSVVRQDVFIGGPSANEGNTPMVKAEQVEGQLTISDLNIKLQPTDQTKAVMEEEDGSYSVRKDANLKLEILPSLEQIAPGLKPRLKFWVTYRNISYTRPAVIQDEDKREGATNLKTLAVFDLIKADATTTIKWINGPQNEAVAYVFNYEELPFITFKTVSSEVKKGNGWILHCQLEFEQNNSDLSIYNTIVRGSVGVKSLKIIRSKTAGGIKRKRVFSSCSVNGANLPPSPITSEDGSGSEDSMTNMTKEEIQIALKHHQSMAMKFAQELCRR